MKIKVLQRRKTETSQTVDNQTYYTEIALRQKLKSMSVNQDLLYRNNINEKWRVFDLYHLPSDYGNFTTIKYVTEKSGKQLIKYYSISEITVRE